MRRTRRQCARARAAHSPRLSDNSTRQVCRVCDVLDHTKTSHDDVSAKFPTMLRVLTHRTLPGLSTDQSSSAEIVADSSGRKGSLGIPHPKRSIGGTELPALGERSSKAERVSMLSRGQSTSDIKAGLSADEVEAAVRGVTAMSHTELSMAVRAPPHAPPSPRRVRPRTILRRARCRASG